MREQVTPKNKKTNLRCSTRKGRRRRWEIKSRLAVETLSLTEKWCESIHAGAEMEFRSTLTTRVQQGKTFCDWKETNKKNWLKLFSLSRNCVIKRLFCQLFCSFSFSTVTDDAISGSVARSLPDWLFSMLLVVAERHRSLVSCSSFQRSFLLHSQFLPRLQFNILRQPTGSGIKS